MRKGRVGSNYSQFIGELQGILWNELTVGLKALRVTHTGIVLFVEQDVLTSGGASGLGVYVQGPQNGPLNRMVGMYSFWLGESLPFEIRGQYMMKGLVDIFPVSCFILLNISYWLFSEMRCWTA